MLVAFSGGKDSLATLELCLTTFRRVEAFFMYLVPGLECVEVQLEAAQKRYGIVIRQHPHWLLSRCIKHGIYRPNGIETDALEEWKLADCYDIARHAAGIELLATGAKRADSLWRRRQLGTWGKRENLIYPLIGWSKFDVLGFLKMKEIPIPSTSAGNATGIDLSTPSLTWLASQHPADFKRLCEVFPYAEAAIKRREWYGI